MLNNRDAGVDAMKGIAILLVVLGHAIECTYSNADRSLVFRLIYSFHMPLFMFVSGYLTSQSSFRAEYLMKRFNVLMVPFFAWLPIAALFCVVRTGGGLSWGGFKAYVVGAILRPEHGGLWFLWVLFLINVLYFFLSKTKRLLVSCAIVSIALFLIQVVGKWDSVFGLGLLAWHFPFFLFGVVCRKHPNRVRLNKMVMFAILPVFCALEYSWFRTGVDLWGVVLTPRWQNVFNVLIGYGVAFIAIVFVVRAAGFVKVNTLFFRWFSENSLAVYSVHAYAVLLLVDQVKKHQFAEVQMCVLVFLGTLALSFASIFVLKKIEFFQRVFFGQKRGLLGYLKNG